MLTLIAAHDRNRAIGRLNDIPWHIPEDFAFFRRTTMGTTVVMGRKTWESLPARPLPGRTNIVISRQQAGSHEGAIFTGLEDVLSMVSSGHFPEVFCIGGEQIYRAMMPIADRMLLTRIDTEIGGSDAWFPEYDESDWVELRRTRLRKNAPSCEVVEFVRRV